MMSQLKLAATAVHKLSREGVPATSAPRDDPAFSVASDPLPAQLFDIGRADTSLPRTRAPFLRYGAWQLASCWLQLASQR